MLTMMVMSNKMKDLWMMKAMLRMDACLISTMNQISLFLMMNQKLISKIQKESTQRKEVDSMNRF